MSLSALQAKILNCKECEPHLPLGANPVFRANENARIMIIGQAPGTKVHASSVPWDDASGDRLREWLGLSKDQFYSPQIAIVPMGFCYPGKGKSGDLPPRTECAPLWHQRLMDYMPAIELTLLIGKYAQGYYLDKSADTLTKTVKNYRDYLPDFLPLPHPSPRNNIWLKKNPWFNEEVLPTLRQSVSKLNL